MKIAIVPRFRPEFENADLFRRLQGALRELDLYAGAEIDVLSYAWGVAATQGIKIDWQSEALLVKIQDRPLSRQFVFNLYLDQSKRDDRQKILEDLNRSLVTSAQPGENVEVAVPASPRSRSPASRVPVEDPAILAARRLQILQGQLFADERLQRKIAHQEKTLAWRERQVIDSKTSIANLRDKRLTDEDRTRIEAEIKALTDNP